MGKCALGLIKLVYGAVRDCVDEWYYYGCLIPKIQAALMLGGAAAVSGGAVSVAAGALRRCAPDGIFVVMWAEPHELDARRECVRTINSCS